MTTATDAAVKVGDIFSRSWGYDQTNVNFYQVISVTPSGKTVRLREIGSSRTESGVVPVPDSFRDEQCAICSNRQAVHDDGSVRHQFTAIYTKRIRPGWKGGAYINWNSYSGASLWDGKPMYATDAYGGH